MSASSAASTAASCRCSRAGNLHESPAAMDYLMRRSIIKRLGQPADIAAAVRFLLSDDAEFITGTMLTVDGGWLVQ
jgi:NAD(P)-dependent dehydrogenase (short-subunit alcohol dehydrogenase family)